MVQCPFCDSMDVEVVDDEVECKNCGEIISDDDDDEENFEITEDMMNEDCLMFDPESEDDFFED